MRVAFIHHHGGVGRSLACLGLLGLVMLADCRNSAAADEMQGWLMESVSKEVDSDTSFGLETSQRVRSASAGGALYQLRAFADHDMTKGLSIGVGAAYSSSEQRQEIGLQQQIIVRTGFLSARTRMEERFLSDVEHVGWRLREKLAMQYRIDDDGRWVAGVGTEFFFHLNHLRRGDQTGLTGVRGQISIEHRVTRHLNVQLAYLRHQTIRNHRIDPVMHAPFLTLKWML